MRAAAVLGLVILGVVVTLTVLGLLLLVERSPSRLREKEPVRLEAEVLDGPSGWRLTVEGPPGVEVLVTVGTRPLVVLTLDEAGTAEAAGSDVLVGDVSVRPLGGPPTRPGRTPMPAGHVLEPVHPAPLLTPAQVSSLPTADLPTATPAPTRTPTPTPTPSPTPSPTPTGTPTRAAPTPAAMPAPDSQRSVQGPPVLHLVTDAGPRIAITFDGAASSNGTEQLLHLLRELDLRATLFLTGEFIEREPALLRRALLDGHEVGNHTWSHPRLTTYAEDRRHRLRPGVTREWFLDQLIRTEAAFRRATGRPLAPLWRAPYGEENGTLRGWAAERGYLHVRWSSLKGSSLDSWDWVDDEHSPLYERSEEMIDRLLRFPRLEGGIILMHLASDRTEPPWTALPRLVRTLRERNLEPVKVTDLLGQSPSWRPRLERAASRHRELNPE